MNSRSKPTGSSAILIHIAGTYYRDTGQSCIVCGYRLAPGVGWDTDKEPDPWDEGGLILIEGLHMVDLNVVEENEVDFPGARKCKNFDDDNEEDDVSWQ